MKALTSDAKFLLSLCNSDALVIKSAISLMMGWTEMMGPKQLVACGLYRERRVGEDGHLFTICEEQVMICGAGAFNWWAQVLWVPAQKRNSRYSKLDRQLMEKVREERCVSAASARLA